MTANVPANTLRFAASLAYALLLLAGCGPSDKQIAADKAAAKEAAASAPLTAPAGDDDNAWKAYLGQVVGKNMDGVTDRVFPYYLPVNSKVADPGGDGSSMYDRQLENVSGVVARTVLPGNMLAFGSPDSTTMGDMIVAAFTGAKPDAFKGSQVLFIGKAADSDRVKAAVEAAGARYIFVEVK
jgi:hypothetical protein